MFELSLHVYNRLHTNILNMHTCSFLLTLAAVRLNLDLEVAYNNCQKLQLGSMQFERVVAIQVPCIRPCTCHCRTVYSPVKHFALGRGA